MWNCSFSISFWAGERGSLLRELILVIFGQGRPISVSAVPFGPGIDIWRSLSTHCCHYEVPLFIAWWGLVVPCSIGANHCRLRHFGWERCGHGLTSRPRESASELFLNELLVLFRYPPGSGRALLAGTLSLGVLRCSVCLQDPSWRLPASGHVDRLVCCSF